MENLSRIYAIEVVRGYIYVSSASKNEKRGFLYTYSVSFAKSSGGGGGEF